MLIISLCLGGFLAKNALGWLPIIASCIATMAVFYMQGVLMRVCLLTSTVLWLVNNVVSGSIGGTCLEVIVAVVNISTIIRMQRDARMALAVIADASALTQTEGSVH
jgi:hypothetical protein